MSQDVSNATTPVTNFAKTPPGMALIIITTVLTLLRLIGSRLDLSIAFKVFGAMAVTIFAITMGGFIPEVGPGVG